MDGSSAERAVLMYNDVLKYMQECEDPAVKKLPTDVAGQIVERCVEVPALRDELYMQLMKQSRNNPDLASKLRVWRLWLVLAASAPPSKVSLGVLSSQRA